ncbi:hypothetical protein BH11ARM2_BH11ARM2_25900 [soil metagenome]
MIPNREDRLVRFAFGDVDERERAEIEAMVANDPEAKRTVEQYRSMRHDFSRLKEVPEDQLSRERLRDAILARGLRTDAAPERSKFGWAWMPLAACVLAFAYVVMPRPSSSSADPTLVAMNDAKPALVDLSSGIQRKSVVAKKIEPKVTKPIIIETPKSPFPRKATVEPDRFDHTELIRHDREESKPKPTNDEGENTKGFMARNDPSPQPTPPVVTPQPTPEPPKEKPSDAPIVIVEPSPEPGTNAAQEVENASNVLVGG